MRFNSYPKSIVVDYTVDGQYKNDCHYFGQSSINIADWAQNNNYYPNLIYAIQQTLDLIHYYCRNDFRFSFIDTSER